jgi:hypothetical protein
MGEGFPTLPNTHAWALDANRRPEAVPLIEAVNRYEKAKASGEHIIALTQFGYRETSDGAVWGTVVATEFLWRNAEHASPFRSRVIFPDGRMGPVAFPSSWAEAEQAHDYMVERLAESFRELHPPEAEYRTVPREELAGLEII